MLSTSSFSPLRACLSVHVRRSVRGLAVAGPPRPDTWDRTERISEDAYFKALDGTQRSKLDDSLHAKELRSLIDALPKRNNLSHADLFKLIMWKVEDQGKRIKLDRSGEII